MHPVHAERRNGLRRRGRLLVGAVRTVAVAAALTLVAIIMPGTANAAGRSVRARPATATATTTRFWTAGGGSACMTLGSGGNYSTS
ncbi:hypothetical protein [Kutzneria kofuensis]|uniref:hypothetical protein n=1 Tax=Kutzneria kofuensis TaxID=103725 RepID=UPI0031E7ADA4